MHRKRARRILGILKKSVELRARHRTRRVDFRGSQRPDEFARNGCRTRRGSRWKSQNRKNVYLSPYVEEPLNAKAIKSFVPELRSCKYFSCFGVPVFYVYMLWTFYVRFTYPYPAMVQCWPSFHYLHFFFFCFCSLLQFFNYLFFSLFLFNLLSPLTILTFRSLLCLSVSLFVSINTDTHTRTHTHTLTSTYLCVCVCIHHLLFIHHLLLLLL